ncbi:aminoglycoside adenylyltransferase domain-containing protein [Paenibacillus sp. MBLB4367]|uniref:aminoglycoside adenylyltransferase domain-containing protein n=1 Tax=Paenibacillus sp. MBLB4367 TaxID=3384767 RepID=UPI0039081042
MSIYGWTDCPEPIVRQLTALRDHLIDYVGHNLVGIYVHGSLALNSFNPDVSDLDVIVLLREGLVLELRYELVKLFLALSNQPAPIEISVIALDAIWPWKHPTPFQLHSSEYWRKAYEEQIGRENKQFWAETPVDPDLACHITLILQRGICLYGKPAQEVFPSVPEQDFRSSILSGVDHAADAVQTAPVYGILTLCRILSYLETGMIISKEEAGQWVLARIPEHIRYVVRQAADTYVGPVQASAEYRVEDLEEYKRLMLAAIHVHVNKA